MPDATLTANAAQRSRQPPAGRLRREGLVPAVVYGLGADTMSVTVPAARSCSTSSRGGSGANTVITLQIGSGADSSRSPGRSSATR